MFRLAQKRGLAVMNAPFAQRRSVILQVEKPQPTLADKIVRGKEQTEFYPHPRYVMSREKMLFTVWKDYGVATLSAYVLVPFFAVAAFFKT